MISLIIPTRNRAVVLEDALDSIAKQEIPRDAFEVIVVDNGSTDNTPDVVAAAKAELPNLRYFLEPEPGLHAGRHRGLQEAVGELLTFADDDIEALPSWLGSVVEGFSDPHVDMIGGNNLPRFLEPPPRWLRSLWEKPSFGGRAIPTLSILELPGGPRPCNPLLVWGCNFSIRKQTLIEAGGFHPDSLPQELIRFRGDGETHVSRYVAHFGGKCIFHPGASVYHKVTPARMTVSYFRQRAYNQGVSDSYTELRRRYLEGGKATSWAPVHGVVRRRLRNIRGKLRGVLARDPDMRLLHRETMRGHADGFDFHQHAFATNPEVHDWVLRPSYLQGVIID
jgi:glycosyltransferase involved in cell wall biosynthesis